LRIFAKLPRTRLEMTEGLEMLRALEHGYGIRVVVVDYKSIGVDTEYELEIVRNALRR
jgi:3-deoxy-manno-octulosonate cytidylyltransferase (CMP-KDO synthetase)